MIGAQQQKPLFGNSATNTFGGNPPSTPINTLSGPAQPALGNTYAGNQQKPFSFGTPSVPSTTQTPAFGFGSSTQQQQVGGSLFGSSVAQQPQQPQQSLFGATQQIQGQSLLQNQPSQPNLSSSFQPQSSQTVRPITYTHAQQGQSLQDQLVRVKDMWDVNNLSSNAFQYYFYNRVEQGQASLYGKPVNHNQQRWDEAVRNRPDDSSVPVLAVGFEDLRRRIATQELQVSTYRNRMHEIVDKLGELNQKHMLSNQTRIDSAKQRQIILLNRTTILASKVQILKSRGYMLRSDEEKLRMRFAELLERLHNPNSFGTLADTKANLLIVSGQIRAAQEEAKGSGIVSGGTIDWGKDPAQLQDIESVCLKKKKKKEIK